MEYIGFLGWGHGVPGGPSSWHWGQARWSRVRDIPSRPQKWKPAAPILALSIDPLNRNQSINPTNGFSAAQLLQGFRDSSCGLGIVCLRGEAIRGAKKTQKKQGAFCFWAGINREVGSEGCP